MTKVILMDLARCVNCRACEVACEREHAGNANIFVQLIDERFALPLNCHHCEESFCTVVCPTQAVHRVSPDAVIVSPMKCIGCGLCTLACPFGSIWLDRINRVARKCDLCEHRTQAGLEPACVTTCSARALTFGEFDTLLAKAKKKKGRLVINRAAGSTGTILLLPPGFMDASGKMSASGTETAKTG
jgi:formate dehydrogenase iron-sulfur subunit